MISYDNQRFRMHTVSMSISQGETYIVEKKSNFYDLPLFGEFGDSVLLYM